MYRRYPIPIISKTNQIGFSWFFLHPESLYITLPHLSILFMNKNKPSLKANWKCLLACSWVTASIGTGSNGSLSTSGAGKSTRPTHRTRTPPSSVRHTIWDSLTVYFRRGSRPLSRLQFFPSVVGPDVVGSVDPEKPWFLQFCDFFLTFYLWKMMYSKSTFKKYRYYALMYSKSTFKKYRYYAFFQFVFCWPLEGQWWK